MYVTHLNSRAGSCPWSPYDALCSFLLTFSSLAESCAPKPNENQSGKKTVGKRSENGRKTVINPEGLTILLSMALPTPLVFVFVFLLAVDISCMYDGDAIRLSTTSIDTFATISPFLTLALTIIVRQFSREKSRCFH